MKSKFLNLNGVKVLSKESQRKIVGQLGNCSSFDLSQCGCSCSGAVTGPLYCQQCVACLQVYDCAEES